MTGCDHAFVTLSQMSQMSQQQTLNKAEAANHLGVSIRTLLRLTGKELAHLPKRRTSDETLYDRAALDAYLRKQEAMPQVSATVIPDTVGAPVTHEESQALARRDASMTGVSVTLGTGGTPDIQAQMLSAFAAMAAPVRIVDKLTLSLAEAAQLAGLSRNHLRAAIEEKKLKARIIGRGWRVKRADLDAYVRKL
jgi:excisionase family DNA binding protein